MSLTTDIQNALTSIAASIPDAAVDVIYRGRSFTAIRAGLKISGIPVAFTDDQASTETLYANSTDLETPQHGEKISVDNKDRIIASAESDPINAVWVIDHSEYYNLGASIYDDPDDIDASEVYELVKVRLLDKESVDFTQYESGDFSKDMRVVLIRRDAWPLDALPMVGYVVEIPDQNKLYVSSVEEYGGDIRLTCREA